MASREQDQDKQQQQQQQGGGGDGGETKKQPASAAVVQGATFMPKKKEKKPLPRRFQDADIYKESYEKCKPKRKTKNPLYRTTLDDLGSVPPTRKELHEEFHPKSTHFTNSFNNQMYRSNSLNCAKPSKKAPAEHELSIY